MKHSFLPYLFKVLILAVLYFGAAKVGLLFSTVEGNVTLVWPPTGLALAALLLFDYRLWPGVALGAFFATASTGAPLGFALATAVGNPLEALAGAYLLHRVGFHNRLTRVRDVLNFLFFGALLSTTLSATIGVAGLSLNGMAPWSAYFSIWWTWWVGDAMGALIVAPVLLTWTTSSHSITQWPFSRWSEALLLLVTGLATALIVFGSWPAANRIHLAFAYLPFPVLLWAGLRFGSLGASTMNLVVNVIAVLGTVNGYGPFAQTTLNESLFLLWIFLGIASVTALVTAAITAERQQAESAWRKSEQAYRTLVEQSLQGITVLQNGRIVFANPAIAAMSGYTLPELYTFSASEVLLALVHPDDRSHLEQAMRDRLAGKAVAPQHEYRFIHKNGTIRWLITQATLIEYEGQPAIQLTMIDITERKQAEEQEAESQQFIQKIFDTNPNVLYIFDLDEQRTVFQNRQVGAAIGYTEKEVLAMGDEVLQQLAHPDDLPRIAAHFARLREAADGDILELEYRMRHVEGSWRWFYSHDTIFDRAPNGRVRQIIGTATDITKRKQAEEALREQNSFRSAIIQRAAEGLCVCHEINSFPYLRFTEWNERMEAITGYTMAEINEKGWYQTVYPDPVVRQRALERIERMRTGDDLQGEEWEITRADGEQRTVAISTRVLETGDGMNHVLALMEDVTQRKRAEEALRQSEARYRAIVDTQTELICRSTPDYVFTFVNEAFSRFLGYPPEELIGQDLMRFTAAENQHLIRDKYAQLTPENPVVNDQQQSRRADGRLRWLHWTNRGIFDESGHLIEIQAVGRDVTEQIEANQQIEFQKTLLECQLEASLDGILIVSPEQEWLYWNQHFIDLWGLPEEIVSTRSSAAALDYIRPQLADPQTFFADVEYLYDHPAETMRVEVALADGRIYDRYSAPVVSDTGTNYGRLWSYRDITRQRELEEQLLQAQKIEAIGRLAGGIAHDFNNILVPITGYVDLSLRQLSSEDNKLYSNLKRVREAADKAAGLTRQILAFSRKQVLEMQVLDLNTVIADFKKMIQRLIGENIQLRTVLNPNLFQVKADKGQIEQVLLNLVVNARDAMPTGGKLTIETNNVYLDKEYVKKYADGQPPGPYIMVAVSDTGRGMDIATQQQIFEPFFTTKGQGKGTGLGLATVFGIVKQHGGNIWVYSEPDKGATFKIYLPKAEGAISSSRKTTAEPASMHGTETILVVEDEEMVRNLVSETLTACGYQVIETGSPSQALHLASEHQELIHLLLTDVVMPEMNGRELYQRVEALYPDIQVLYMSGYTDNVIDYHGILDRGVNFLQKPFTIYTLTQKIRQVLD